MISIQKMQERTEARCGQSIWRTGGQFLSMALMAFAFCVVTAVSGPAWSASQSIQKDVDAIIQQAMDAGGYPGVAVLIEKDGKTLAKSAYGIANLEWQTEVDTDTVFAIGSVTKSFTGLAIAQLVDAGKLSLDDQVSKFFPDFPADKHAITVRQLMNHTSGLFNYTNSAELQAAAIEPHTHEEMFAWFKDVPLAFEPGSQFSYTNSGTYLLGVIVEKVSGQSYADYVRTQITEPFGMNDTAYADFSKIVPKRAAGYRGGPDGLVNGPRYSPSVPFSAGSMNSTLDDLAIYARAVHQSDMVSSDIRDILYTQEKLADGSTLQYALGCIGLQDFEGHRKISHAGDIYGYAAHFAHYPEDKVTVIVLTNRDGVYPIPSSIEHKLARLALDLPAPEIAQIALSAEDAMPFMGDFSTYPVAFGPELMGFDYRDGMLIFAMGGIDAPVAEIPLIYQGDGRFVTIIDDEMTIEFGEGASQSKTAKLNFYDGVFSLKRVD